MENDRVSLGFQLHMELRADSRGLCKPREGQPGLGECPRAPGSFWLSSHTALIHVLASCPVWQEGGQKWDSQLAAGSSLLHGGGHTAWVAVQYVLLHEAAV